MTKQDPRNIFADTLLNAVKQNPRIVAISCDSASGAGLGLVKEQFPQQFIEAGIAEQNAIGVAAGLATCGYIPLVTAIAPFITMRCYEQIRDELGYANQNVKVVGSSSGLAFSTLGSTHQALEDIAVLRTIPNLVILNPGDAYEVAASLKAAFEHRGPVYIRMPRHKSEDLVDAIHRNFTIGSAEVFNLGKDVNCLVTGVLNHQAKEACELLKQQGLSVGLINFPCLKPLPVATIKTVAQNCRLLVSIEEHSVSGGFGTMVAEVMAETGNNAPLLKIGVPEGATAVGPYPELLEYYGLTAAMISKKIIETLGRR